MGLETVGGLAMHIILSKLGPDEAASVACLNRRFHLWASDDSLWAKFCAQDLNLSSPLDPSGNPVPSFKVLLLPLFKKFSEITCFFSFSVYVCLVWVCFFKWSILISRHTELMRYWVIRKEWEWVIKILQQDCFSGFRYLLHQVCFSGFRYR